MKVKLIRQTFIGGKLQKLKDGKPTVIDVAEPIARQLLAAKKAVPYDAKVEKSAAESKKQQESEAKVIEKINAAKTVKELEGLIPKEPYGNAIATAINDRMAELENVQ